MNRTNNIEPIFTVYQIAGYLTAIWVYCGGALNFMMTGQAAMLIGWLALMGPFLSGLAGILWPFYWLYTLNHLGAL